MFEENDKHVIIDIDYNEFIATEVYQTTFGSSFGTFACSFVKDTQGILLIIRKENPEQDTEISFELFLMYKGIKKPIREFYTHNFYDNDEIFIFFKTNLENISEKRRLVKDKYLELMITFFDSKQNPISMITDEGEDISEAPYQNNSDINFREELNISFSWEIPFNIDRTEIIKSTVTSKTGYTFSILFSPPELSSTRLLLIHVFCLNSKMNNDLLITANLKHEGMDLNSDFQASSIISCQSKSTVVNMTECFKKYENLLINKVEMGLTTEGDLMNENIDFIFKIRILKDGEQYLYMQTEADNTISSQQNEEKCFDYEEEMELFLTKQEELEMPVTNQIECGSLSEIMDKIELIPNETEFENRHKIEIEYMKIFNERNNSKNQMETLESLVPSMKKPINQPLVNYDIENERIRSLIKVSNINAKLEDRIPISEDLNLYPNYPSNMPIIEEKSPYVGLQNQGATCYMNSVLQFLFHLPQFRRMVYEMPTTGREDPDKSIPLNMQHLFCQLQTSEQAVSTKALTKSFGWSSYQTFMQHDVQEFCRILLDNLEEKIKGTPQEGSIENLFKGQTNSYIRCTDVEYESKVFDDFYDLQMTVKGCLNLHDSFVKFIQQERLEGDNKYETEKYGKQNAVMGTEFAKFPNVLMLHLRRTEYDFVHDRNVKIKERFEYPPQIDLSEFLSKDADHEECNVFELTGVLVHAGDSGFGHYYSFLRTSADNQWYEFNDSHVSKATYQRAVEDNFGGKLTNYSSKNYSAYMLIYVRKSAFDIIYAPIDDDSIPEHIKNYNPPIIQRPTPVIAALDDPALIDTDSNSSSSFDEIIIYSEKDWIDQKSESIQMEYTVTTTSHSIYVELSKKLNLELGTFRLWQCNSGLYPKRILSDIRDIIHFSGNRLILIYQILKENDTIDINSDEIILFESFFFRGSLNPIHYLGYRKVNKNDIASSVFPEISKAIGYKEDTMYEICLKTKKECSGIINNIKYGESNIPNGSLIIYQLPEGAESQETTIEINTDVKPKKDKRKIYQLEYDPSCIPNNMLDYIVFLENMISVKIYDFNNGINSHHLLKLKISKSYDLPHVKDMIIKSLNLQLDPDHDLFVLHKANEMKYPSIRHYKIEDRKCFKPLLLPSKIYAFYHIYHNITESDLNNMCIYEINYSEDGLQNTQSQYIPAIKNTKLEDLITHFTNIKLDPKQEYRYLGIKKHKIKKYLKLDEHISNELRIRIEPGNTENVIKCYMMKKKFQDFDFFGNPFLIKCIEGEKFIDTKARILDCVKVSNPGLDNEKLVFYKDTQDDIDNDYILSNENEDDIIIYIVDSSKDQQLPYKLVMNPLNFEYRRKEEGIKIYN